MMSERSLSPLALPSLAAGYFTLGVGSLAVVGLIDPIAAEFTASRAAVAQLVTAFALTYAVAAPLLQTVIGGWDRRWAILLGLGLIAVAAAAGALTDSFAILAASRLVMAIGAAMVGPMASSLAASVVPDAQRGAALGKVFAGMTMATVLGVPLAGWLGGIVGWRGVIWAVAAMAVLTAVAVWQSVPSGSVGMRSGMAALKGVLLNRVLTPAIGVTLFQMASQFAIYALIAAYLMSEQGVPAAMVPVALAVYGVGGVLGNSVATMLLARIAAERLILGSLVGMLMIYLALGMLHLGPIVALSLLGLWAVVGMLMMAPQQARLVMLAPEQRNLLLALNASALYLGMGGGSVVAGALFSHFGGAGLPYAAAVIAMLAIGSFVASERRQGAN